MTEVDRPKPARAQASRPAACPAARPPARSHPPAQPRGLSRVVVRNYPEGRGEQELPLEAGWLQGPAATEGARLTQPLAGAHGQLTPNAWICMHAHWLYSRSREALRQAGKAYECQYAKEASAPHAPSTYPACLAPPVWPTTHTPQLW